MIFSLVGYSVFGVYVIRCDNFINKTKAKYVTAMEFVKEFKRLNWIFKEPSVNQEDVAVYYDN